MALQSGTASSGRQAALDAGRPPPLDARGLAGLGDIELLALATGRGVGHAAAFLERLGGLRQINSAGVAELARAGLPAGRATALAAACELLRRVAAAPPTARWVIRRPADLADHLLPGMALLDREELRVALLDTKNVVTALRTVYLGSLAGSPVRVGEVFRDAVRENAAALLVVHNHPSGDPTPSTEDLRITVELAEAGRLLDVPLLDHLVMGRERWVSLRALGALQPHAD
jgi:DNA repair protein RadC